MAKFPARSVATSLAAVLVLMVIVPNALAKGGAKPPRAAPHSAPKPPPAPHPAHHTAQVPRQSMPRPPKAPQQAMSKPPKAPRPVSTRHANTQRFSAHATYRRGTHRSRRGYGYSTANRNTRAQRMTRAIISRLRSAQATLARLNHPYQGHRVRAMHAISTALRHLGHSSARRSRSQRSSTLLAAQKRRGAGNRPQATRAQADVRVRKSLRMLASVEPHMTYSPRHLQARVSVRRAMQELNTGLRTR